MCTQVDGRQGNVNDLCAGRTMADRTTAVGREAWACESVGQGPLPPGKQRLLGSSIHASEGALRKEMESLSKLSYFDSRKHKNTVTQ